MKTVLFSALCALASFGATSQANATPLDTGAWTQVARMADDGDFLPEVVRPKARAIGPVIQGTFAKAYKAGVKIAFGTDCGVSPHGENHREFVLMEQLGMPAMEVIQSATMGGAQLLRIDDELGSVESGKLADLVAVAGNPLQDMSVMSDVRWVMTANAVPAVSAFRYRVSSSGSPIRMATPSLSRARPA